MQKKRVQLISLVLLGFVSVTAVQGQTRTKVRKDTVREIDEVVVTALGIKRQDKALGYVAQKVGADTFEETQNNNWAQAMDSFITRRLMLACERNVSRTTGLTPGTSEEINSGTDAYWTKVATLFNKVVLDTQSMPYFVPPAKS